MGHGNIEASHPESVSALDLRTCRRTACHVMAAISLKAPEKDMERSLHLWKAGMNGAQNLQSEQRFTEALSTYHIMEVLWPGDQRIGELREFITHWELNSSEASGSVIPGALLCFVLSREGKVDSLFERYLRSQEGVVLGNCKGFLKRGIMERKRKRLCSLSISALAPAEARCLWGDF